MDCSRLETREDTSTSFPSLLTSVARRWLLAMRLVAYTLFIYLWELSWGLGLRLLGACPWDYSGYRYNLEIGRAHV